MGCATFKPFQDLGFRRTEHLVNEVHLVKFIASWEQRYLLDKFEKDAAEAPDVHFFVIVAVGH